MKDLTPEQQKLFEQFIEILKNEESMNILESILNLNKENKLKEVLNNINEIEKACEYANELRSEHDYFYGTKDDKGDVTQQGIITKLQEACEKIEQNKGKIGKIEEFYTRVFEGIKDESGKMIKFSLENEIESYSKKINELLPNATSAGLASAYKQEKEYIETKITFWNKVFSFSIVLFILVFGGYFYLTFQDGFSYISFLRAIPIWIFSGFFTFYSTKQIAEYKRMASEYAHKQTLNATYTGYQNQINEIGGDKLEERLLEIMLDSAKLNPSETLGSKGEIPSLSVMEKIIEHLPADTLRKLYSKTENILNKPQS